MEYRAFFNQKMALFKENHFGQLCVKHSVKCIIKINGNFSPNWFPYCRSSTWIKTNHKLKVMESSHNYFVQCFLICFVFLLFLEGEGRGMFGVGIGLVGCFNYLKVFSWQYLTERKGERQSKLNQYSASKPHGCNSHISNCKITSFFQCLGLVKCHCLTWRKWKVVQGTQ